MQRASSGHDSRPWVIGGQFQYNRRPGQSLLPPFDTGLQLFQLPTCALPAGEIHIAETDCRQRARLLPVECAIQDRELVKQQSKRPSVTSEMVNRQLQNMLFVGDFVEDGPQ